MVGLGVVTARQIVVAVLLASGKNGSVPPWGGVPVWVVVALLGALIASSGTSGVLPGLAGGVVTYILVSFEKS